MIRSLVLTGFFASSIAIIAIGAPGCAQTGIGDPCTPEPEYDPKFNGFGGTLGDPEISVESKSFQCQTRVCLVNRFRGRASCPYGQDEDGNAPGGGKPCNIPGTSDKVTGDPERDPVNRAKVFPQCADRQAAQAVYCSCRCANVDGKTDDGANYCTCPDGFSCSQLVSSIGAADTGLTGAYCIKSGTEFVQGRSCGEDCDPTRKNCQ